MRELLLLGAYGRIASLADWDAGKDFKIFRGPYCSKRDVAAMRRDYDAVVLLADDGTEVVRIAL